MTNQVDDPRKKFSLAERILHGEGVGSESLPHHADNVFEVGPDSVHLVDQRYARDTVAVGLSPNRLRLGLDPSHGTEHRNGAIEHTQRSLDLGGEINVPRRIDDVDTVLGSGPLPMAGRGGRRNGDPPLLFLLHPIHRGGALVDLTDPVEPSRIVKHPFRRRRLTGVDVRHDADIAQVL